MDFKNLLEPYCDLDASGSPKRTIEGQIKWLTKRHGIERSAVDQAILKVFNELENGLKFEDDAESTAGHKLDQYLLNEAEDIQKSALDRQAKELELFMTTFKQSAVEEYVKAQQSSVWKRVKAVFKPA